jgi:mRNA-degrading endonuclease RelE of RelBE toxin-antitoxin system/PHD/YefM family antitoxin component YafN of YafNO toxin-antitoxin module
VKHVDLLDLSDEVRDLVRECEAKGAQTVFERNGRAVSVLVSWDEYLALRETIEIANDPLFFAHLAEADQQIENGEFIAGTRFGDGRRLERLRFAKSFAEDWRVLTEQQRASAAKSLPEIDDNPILGAPLFEPLKGLWSHRTGELRIVYRIVSEAKFVAVLAITNV